MTRIPGRRSDVRTSVTTCTGVDVLKVEWQPGTGATMATLVGPIDADAEPVVFGIGRVAEVARKVIVDLARVTGMDWPGAALVRELGSLPNVVLRFPVAA
jgi:hypothetical protein